MIRTRYWTLLLAIAPSILSAQRDESMYVDASVASRYLWRTQDFGGPLAELGAGLPFWWTNPTQPQRGFLIDAHSWIPATSWDARKSSQQTRVRAQFVATSDRSLRHNWEVRADYSGYLRPQAAPGLPTFASEVSATLTTPMYFERRNIPVRFYASAQRDLDYYDGTRGVAGVEQDKELFGTTLHWTVEGSANNYASRRTTYEGLALDLFVGKTPHAVSVGSDPTDLVAYWKQYGLALDVLVPGQGLKGTRAGVGIRWGTGRSPPWIR